MIYLQLFLTFFAIGAVSFGGGLTVISLVQDVMTSTGWMTAEELTNFVAVAESTPGPFAVNLATFIGSKFGGILGSIVSTIGVILPAFLIILLVVTILKKLFNYKPVEAFLKGIQPAIVGILFGTALTLILPSIFGINTFNNYTGVNYKNIIIFAIICLTYFLPKKCFKKNVSPIILIVISAGLGLLMYGV